MVPEVGQLFLLFAFAVAALLGTLPMIGAHRGRADWMALARPAAVLQSGMVAGAFGCLTYSFVVSDFSVLYVAANSNTKLPLAYRIAGVWGGHEGSLLLWNLMLGVWMVAVSAFSRHLPQAVSARILAVMGLISMGFLAFMLITSNPFVRLLPVPADGRDLNPLLQDPGMVLHPPMLYMGYVGFCVAFAFAIAALLGGQLDATWARWARPWTAVAWVFLTIGIALGSGWAYYELGWGGWWFWDPVENASFMPWLAGTALMHSLAVTEKRGSFKVWTVLLALTAFALSLLGTFLVRSGVLSSVHAFATDPRRGLFILGFLAVVVGSSLALFAWRAPKVGLGARFGVISKEAMLLGNNVLLLVAMAAVLLGTLYPLVLDALGAGKISVGPPYFETVFVGLMVPVVVLLGVGPATLWKHDELKQIARRVRLPAAASLLAAVVIPLWAGQWRWGAALGAAMTAWIATTTVADVLATVRPYPGNRQRWLSRLGQVPRAMWGMWLAHLGVAAFAFGVTMVKSYEIERDVRMDRGDTTEVSGYVFTLRGTQELRGPNYVALQADIAVTRDGHEVAIMRPEKRIYAAQGNPMTEAAIHPGVTRDLYVSMGEQLPGSAWVVRVYLKPFVDWIWGGCLLMALGGALAALDRRYARRRAADANAPRTAAAPSGSLS